MKRISLIILCLLIFGCKGSEEVFSKYEPKPCIRKYPVDDYGNWKIICEQTPFVNGQFIPQDLIFALQKVGFLCSGHSFPTPKEVNLICEDQYIKLNE